MSMEGTQLARAMMSIHELDVRQAARDPGCLLTDRIERRALFRTGGHRTVCQIGRFLERAGLRLQEYGIARQPLPGNATPQR